MTGPSYYRPLVQFGPARPENALPLAGGAGWFTTVEVLERQRPACFIAASEMPEPVALRLTAPRAAVCGLTLDQPRVMGILNATPDSFSDGGLHAQASSGIAAGLRMQTEGADLLDIGGESTRPGALAVPVIEEIDRVRPIIEGLRHSGIPLSVDTRKTAVAAAAMQAGAGLINDVSGLGHDPTMAAFCAEQSAPACIMHAQGDPETMQNDPHYDDVLLDVYDALDARIEALISDHGLARENILADPGIGFGKTMAHNLALLARLGLFHGLGVPILLGASRKKFIGTIGNGPVPVDRVGGSLGVALAAVSHGVQVLRVHDVRHTKQAVALWQAAMAGS